MPEELSILTSLTPGDYYEDCACHPCLCIETNREENEISGISLVDGSYPRCCSFKHCGVRKLSFEEAMHWKIFGPIDYTLDATRDWTTQIPKEYWIENFRILPNHQDTEQDVTNA